MTDKFVNVGTPGHVDYLDQSRQRYVTASVMPDMNIMAHAMGIAARHLPLTTSNDWRRFKQEFIKRFAGVV